MAKVYFGSPWLAGAGGLGQGLTQGLLTGAELQEQRRRAEQEKQARALQLLMQGMKSFSDDPEAGKQFVDWWSLVTGQKVPPWSGGGKSATQKEMQKYQELVSTLGEEGAKQAVWGVKQKPSEKHYIMTPQGPQEVPEGKYHNLPTFMQPSWTWNPDTGQPTPAPSGHFVTPPKLPKPLIPKPTTATEMKVAREEEQIMTDTTKSPDERMRAAQRYKQMGGKVSVGLDENGNVIYKPTPPPYRKQTTGAGGLPPAFVQPPEGFEEE